MVSKKLLYVDDDADLRDLAGMALELDDGLEVEFAALGAEALRRMRASTPDVVLLDVMMPGMDGPTVLREMRDDADLRQIVVIFVTARALPEEQRRLLELGAAGVVIKPFDPMTLATNVRQVMGA